ncbi:hypothetical protein [Cerasicoccus frondis]|uniref:hypothetical protein n=1 Tax=Cerasicoccus frondis TaxID=490090 RepID=UPI0028527987|nr:hypothetical protein [Cerasicoccus frondis]
MNNYSIWQKISFDPDAYHVTCLEFDDEVKAVPGVKLFFGSADKNKKFCDIFYIDDEGEIECRLFSKTKQVVSFPIESSYQLKLCEFREPGQSFIPTTLRSKSFRDPPLAYPWTVSFRVKDKGKQDYSIKCKQTNKMETIFMEFSERKDWFGAVSRFFSSIPGAGPFLNPLIHLRETSKQSQGWDIICTKLEELRGSQDFTIKTLEELLAAKLQTESKSERGVVIRGISLALSEKGLPTGFNNLGLVQDNSADRANAFVTEADVRDELRELFPNKTSLRLLERALHDVDYPQFDDIDSSSAQSFIRSLMLTFHGQDPEVLYRLFLFLSENKKGSSILRYVTQNLDSKR